MSDIRRILVAVKDPWRAQAMRLSRVLGPGLTTGAADDDPCGIAANPDKLITH